MTHLDTLRHMLAVRPCGRHCGCGGCQERAALEEAIRVMEREAAALDAAAVEVRTWRNSESGNWLAAAVNLNTIGGSSRSSVRLKLAAKLRRTALILEEPIPEAP